MAREKYETPWNELIDLTGSENWPLCKNVANDPKNHTGTLKFATFKVEYIGKDEDTHTQYYCTGCRSRRQYGPSIKITDFRRKGTHS